MSYPQTLIDQVVNHAAVMDDEKNPPEEVRAAYSETVEAHSVIEIELTSGKNYLMHIEDIEAMLKGLEQPLDANGDPTEPLGADIGSWCIKTLGENPVYGLLTSEDRSGRHTCHLYQSQLDRLKKLGTIIFRDKTSGIVLDSTAVAALA